MLPQTSGVADFGLFRRWLRESLGRQFWGAKESRKAGHSSKRNLKAPESPSPYAKRQAGRQEIWPD